MDNDDMRKAEKAMADKKQADIKARVMESIKTKKIKMRSHVVFVAEKLGLEGGIFLSLLLGTIFVSLIFYSIEKIKLGRFLTLGLPGARIFLDTLPYEYIFLFLLTLFMAIYLANSLELFCGSCERTDIFTAWFFLGALALGIFLGVMGVGAYFGGWSQNKIPHDIAIHGQIKSFQGNEVTVIEENGDEVQIFMPGPIVPPMPGGSIRDKFLRAVGKRDKADAGIFHAEKVRCCDDD